MVAASTRSDATGIASSRRAIPFRTPAAASDHSCRRSGARDRLPFVSRRAASDSLSRPRVERQGRARLPHALAATDVVRSS